MADELRRALSLATEVALEAGGRIRAELHRSDGPRAVDPSHAVIDAELEARIRARLLEAFPDYGYVGEETGAQPARASHLPTWWVDPHDGTRAFLQGHRGSTVAIGLVRDGVPVLGVVYAPCAPDDGGDLFTWAEGEPLRRNGEPVARAALPVALDATGVVALNPESAARAAGWSGALAPARFRSVASIAYRLALCAAGEVDAAISLGRPAGWDVAAGHALLRAVGGTLLDRSGAPFVYGADADVFGGSPAVARWLAGRRWPTLHDEPLDALSQRYPPLRPAPRRHVADAGRLARAQGALFGQLAGDSLGGRVEFSSPRLIAQHHPGGVRELADGGVWRTLAGQATDDSEMALMLARALVAAEGFDEAAVLDAYRAWHRSGPFDIGNTTRSALEGHPNAQSEANGSLMRASPLGIFGHALPPEARASLAQRDSALTHPNPVCGDACAAFSVALGHAVRTGASPREVYEAAVGWAEGAGAHRSVRQALRDAATAPPAQAEGWVLNALQNAFFQLLHAPSIEEALVATVGRGADSDTNAAICGALLGAVHGREGLPMRWRRAILACRPLPGTPRPRPACFWPVDLPELAERLLWFGARHAGVAAG